EYEPTKAWVREEGVADLASARASVQLTVGPSPEFDVAMEKLGVALSQRFPWLGIDTEGNGEGGPIDWPDIYVGLHRYLRYGDRWVVADGVDDVPAGGQRLMSDPTSVLEH